MADDVIGGCVATGAGLGCLAGLAVGIWACVKYVEPAFEATKGINESGAKALTALVALGGGLESTMAGGAIGGAITFAMAGCFLACCVGAIACCTEAPSVSRQNNASQYHSAAPTLFRQTIPSKERDAATAANVATMV